MAKLLPYLLRIGEALIAGIGVGYAAYQGGGNLNAALIAGVGAALAKLLPSQVTPAPKA